MQKMVWPWQRAPFLRLFPPLALGILAGWPLALALCIGIMLFLCLLLVGYALLAIRYRYSLRWAAGICIHLLLFTGGLALYQWHDVQQEADWFGNHSYQQLLVRLEGPLTRKQNSWKGEATVLHSYENNKGRKAAGKVLLYFSIDANTQNLHYGRLLLLHNPLPPVKGAGNPGAFDYGRWCRFQGITHGGYLAKNTYTVLDQKEAAWWKEILFSIRTWVLQTLRLYFKDPATLGLAEALLIGYKDDLDKNLLQSYSNTGVVHVIAISGLHLGLIYTILMLLTRPLSKGHRSRTLRLVLILAGLWLFSIVAGAGPSIIRSAVMFSCIAFGAVLQRRTAIMNTLALSAFLLLCYNPYWLWDAGFQLSYTAVLSIVLFYRPVYHWFLFHNKLLDAAWKVTAVSIAAQVLTLPVSTFHFHQFPTWFLFTNIVAVPLSSAILVGEILLCTLSFLQPYWLASLLETGMRWMNAYVLYFDTLAHPAWTGLSITFLQAAVFMILVLLFCYWLLDKKKWMLWGWITALLVFVALRTSSFIACQNQERIIVYNIPKKSAIDLVAGRRYLFTGDSALLHITALTRFHMQPSRTAARIYAAKEIPIPSLFRFAGKATWLLRDKPLHYPDQGRADLLIISKKGLPYSERIIQKFPVGQVVTDASVPLRAAKKLEAQCRQLGIPFHHVGENGAFVLGR